MKKIFYLRSFRVISVLLTTFLLNTPNSVLAQSDTFLPLDLEPISVNNASQVTQLGLLQVGYPVFGVTFSGDGLGLTAGGSKTTMWEIMFTGEQVASADIAAFSVAYVPDGDRLILGMADGDFLIIDPDLDTTPTLQGHDDVVTNVVFNGDGTRFVSAGLDNTVHLWDAKTNTELAVMQGTFATINRNGTVLATCDAQSGDLMLWDVDTSTEQHIPRYKCAGALAFSPDRMTLASAAQSGEVTLWDVATKTQLAQLRGEGNSISINYSSDGKMLVSGNDDGSISLWDVETGEQVVMLTGHTDMVMSVVFSNSGDVLASGSVDGTVLLWGVSESVGQVDSVASTPIQNATPTSEPRLATGTFVYDAARRNGQGTLTIENGQDLDAVAILTTLDDTPVASVYIRSGGTFTITGIEDGVYNLYFTLGENWDSLSSSFTSRTQFFRFEDPLPFETSRTLSQILYTTFTVTLQPVVGGTADTAPVDASQFPVLK